MLSQNTQPTKHKILDRISPLLKTILEMIQNKNTVNKFALTGSLTIKIMESE